MGHYAKIVNGIVTDVIVADQDYMDKLQSGDPNLWLQTSYNTKGNVHYGQDGLPDGGVALRGNFAGIGFIYDSENDVFYAPQPYPSWILNNSTWIWEPPIPQPELSKDKIYIWNEEKLAWDEINIETEQT